MIISDLQYLANVDEADVKGGDAIANASAYANAYGTYFAGTTTSTSTYASSSHYYYYYPSSNASSSSSSNSTAV